MSGREHNNDFHASVQMKDATRAFIDRPPLFRREVARSKWSSAFVEGNSVRQDAEGTTKWLMCLDLSSNFRRPRYFEILRGRERNVQHIP